MMSMSGYIGVTDRDWFNFHKIKRNNQCIFWRKARKPVHLNEGTYFFFLVKKAAQYLPGNRLIEGYGTVESIDSGKIKLLWNKYGEELGSSSLHELCTKLDKFEEDTIGYYRLINVTYLKGGVDLELFELLNEPYRIEFKKNIVSGKSIDYYQNENLLEKCQEREYN